MESSKSVDSIALGRAFCAVVGRRSWVSLNGWLLRPIVCCLCGVNVSPRVNYTLALIVVLVLVSAKRPLIDI